ncbi:uncharacterized protein [Panulirus ornatus]|uniref:uncharacterized protein n=1 Tax=Panulirus ornatus TaxID=150431 RepID=UPI003A87DF44
MGGAGAQVRPQGWWSRVVLATVCVAMMMLRSSSSYPIARHCQFHKDCSPGEFCKDQQECHCRKDFVREPRGACLAVRRSGEPCRVDEQCSRLDARLVCYNERCRCPYGIKLADGSCIYSAKPRPPTIPAFTGSIDQSSEQPRKIPRKDYNTVIVLLLIVIFIALLLFSAYHFYIRSHRGAVRLGEEANPSSRRPSIASLQDLSTIGDRDAPPSYNSLPPPSYEQATQYVATISSPASDIPLIPRQKESSVADAEEPRSLPSPDTSSEASYSSGLATTSPLSPSIGFSITDTSPPGAPQSQSEYSDANSPCHRERY